MLKKKENRTGGNIVYSPTILCDIICPPHVSPWHIYITMYTYLHMYGLLFSVDSTFNDE